MISSKFSLLIAIALLLCSAALASADDNCRSINNMINEGQDAAVVIVSSISGGVPPGDVIKCAYKAGVSLRTILEAALSAGISKARIASILVEAGASREEIATLLREWDKMHTDTPLEKTIDKEAEDAGGARVSPSGF